MKTNSLDFDAQALREKILDLAMRGKLVKQDPNDEPASVLLEKIKAEKAELVKEGKIKKSKALPEITDEEKPFDIPDSWEWVRLGEILKPELHKKPDVDFIYIDIASVDNKMNEVTAPTKIVISKDKVASRARQILSKNDILFSVVRPYLKNIAMVPDTDQLQIGSTGFYVLKPFSLINRQYIFYLVLSNYVIQNMTKKMKGDNSPSIRKGDLQNFIIPLPPLKEQSRIAAKIAQLFALLRKVETSTQQYAELQTLLKSKVLDLAMRGKLVEQDPNDEPASVLLEKIKAEKDQLIKEKKIKKSKPLPPITDDEKPFEIPDSWEWVRLGDVFNITSSKRVMKNEWKDKGIPFYRAREIVSINKNQPLKDPIFIDETTYEKKVKISGIPKINDILLTGVGTLGIPYIITSHQKFYFKDGNIIWLKNIGNINSEFTSFYVQSPYMIKQINNGQGTTVSTLTIVRSNNLLIPLPSLTEQSRIVDKIKRILTLFLGDK